jgi:uncharacterized membrane protein
MGDEKKQKHTTLNQNMEFLLYRMDAMNEKLDDVAAKIDRTATDFDKRLIALELRQSLIEQRVLESATKSIKQSTGVDWTKIIISIIGALTLALTIIGTLVGIK